MYYYIKYLTGLIIGIYNVDGKIVARYEYDAWGNHKVINDANTDIGTVSPFRYRGYYYYDETGYFWLSSRYYVPEWDRFLTPDNITNLEPTSISGLNLYVYANNNSIFIGLGALGGLASGRGAQHYKSIGSNLEYTGRTGAKAITTAFQKYGYGTVYQRVLNAWGSRMAASLAKSISQTFTRSAMIIFGTTILNYNV